MGLYDTIFRTYAGQTTIFQTKSLDNQLDTYFIEGGRLFKLDGNGGFLDCKYHGNIVMYTDNKDGDLDYYDLLLDDGQIVSMKLRE